MTFIPTATFDENGELEIMTGEKVQRGSMSYIKLGKRAATKDDVQKMSQAEAEQVVLDTDFGMLSNPPMKDATPEEKRAANLRRAGSNIATKSKRGQARTIIYSTADATKIEECKEALTGPRDISIGGPLGPMVAQVGLPTGSADEDENKEPEWDFFEDSRLPEGKALVLYRSTDEKIGDNAFIYVEDEGLIVNSGYAPVDKYGVFVRI